MSWGSRVWRERSWWLSFTLTALTACGGGAGGGAPRQAVGGGAAVDTAQGGATGVNDRLILASAKTALPPPGVMPADLPDPNSEGAKAVAQFCIACHNLPTPTLHSATDWPSVARRMWLRMDLLPEGLRVPVPTEEQRQAILNYLLGHALQVSGAALPEGAGRSTFSKMCSRCHALPDPRQHSRADWPAVVTRMEQRMDQMKVDRPGQGQVSEIILYLQEASRRK